MKRVLVGLLLIMAVLAVNAQTTKATTTEGPVRTPVLVADLQKAITDNIAKDYTGYTIRGATGVTENGVVTYEVGLYQGSMTMILLYDKDGKFIKKLPPVPKKL